MFQVLPLCLTLNMTTLIEAHSMRASDGASGNDRSLDRTWAFPLWTPSFCLPHVHETTAPARKRIECSAQGFMGATSKPKRVTSWPTAISPLAHPESPWGAIP